MRTASVIIAALTILPASTPRAEDTARPPSPAPEIVGRPVAPTELKEIGIGAAKPADELEAPDPKRILSTAVEPVRDSNPGTPPPAPPVSHLKPDLIHADIENIEAYLHKARRWYEGKSAEPFLTWKDYRALLEVREAYARMSLRRDELKQARRSGRIQETLKRMRTSIKSMTDGAPM